MVPDAGGQGNEGKAPDTLEPVEGELVSDRSKLTPKQDAEWRELGYERIRSGKVAVVILAGG